MYHWTDHNIKIHALYCVLAYTYLCLLHRRVQQAGVFMSKVDMMGKLSRIREVMLLYAPRGRGNAKTPKPVWQIETMDDDQKELYDVLGLDRFAAH